MDSLKQIATLIVFLYVSTSLLVGEQKPLQTVAHVNLSKYVGRWYEYARYPNRFERACAGNAEAFYSMRSSGKLEIRNECSKKNGRLKVSKGSAKIADTRTNAKLRVTFFWPLYGDYWIIGLAPEYRRAVVGEPKRRYLWVLTRTPDIDETTYRNIERLVAEHGYAPDRLVRTPQKQGISK